MTDWLLEFQARQKQGMAGAKAMIPKFLPELKKLAITTITIHYNGSGDDGQIDSIYANAGEALVTDLLHKTLMIWPKNKGDTYNKITQKWDSHFEEIFMPLFEVMEDWGYQVLNHADFDWVNNEGGYGDVILNVTEGTFKIEHNQRYESSNYSEYEP